MFTLPRLIRGTLFVLFLFTTVFAQENRAPLDSATREPAAAIPTAPLVTATATAERVRFVSPGSVVQLRLEVYNEAGQKIFDTELRGGNVLDWYLQDGAGQLLQTGAYACVMTSKSLSGRLSQRVGLVTVAERKVAFEAGAQISMAQQQTIGPLEGNAAFTVLQESDAEAMTTVTHDGAEGQVARTRGALSFRVGDLFSGNDKEQMRLTEDGRLGIGTNNPQANLDVAGTIRAERVLIAKPAKPGNQTQTGNTDPGMDVEGAPQPLTSGSGTQNRIAKWTDNLGTLGDSGITETTAGFVGIGTTNPQALLHVGENPGFGSTAGLVIANNLDGAQYSRAFQLAPRQTASPLTNSIMMYAQPTVNQGVTVPGQFGIFVGVKQGPGAITSYAALATGASPSLGASNNTHLLMGTPKIPAGNFAIFDNTGHKSFFKGSVGIGTTAPQTRLDVRGDVKLGSSGELFAPGGEENLRIVRGIISVEGNVVAGSGFQVSHPATGRYTITFDTPFTGTPTVTATSFIPGETVSPTIIAVQSPASSGVTVRQYCYNLNLCSDVDAYFHFIAIGPR